jgi:GxxExxY protein
MNTNEHECRMDDVVRAVIGAAYTVSNSLGCGFLEKVYERALVFEIRSGGLKVKPNVAFSVFYRGQNVGRYVADLVVEDSLVVELKCVDCFSNEHMAQCLNYLRASKLKLAPLIKFPEAQS